VRRDVFERLNIRDRWRGTLSDDFTITRAMNEAGLDIVFVPRALTASVEDCTWRGLFEFTTRQMKITRVYSSNLWALSFFGSGLFTLVMLASLGIVIFSRTNDWPVIAAIVTLIAVAFFSVGKSWLRMKAVGLVLDRYHDQLRRQMVPQLTLWSVVPAVFLYNCFAALLSRQMIWRGKRYRMVSHEETIVLP
jgi:hypothetical protein